MEFKKILQDFKNKLKAAGKSEDEAVTLFSYLLKLGKAELLLLKTIDSKMFKKASKILNKRLAKNMPLDKIINTKTFYGQDFYVNKHVLSPRPETELLAEKAIDIIKDLQNAKHSKEDKSDLNVLDLCCGTGAIGLTIAKETGVMVMLSDVSKKAINACKKNAKRLLTKDEQGFIIIKESDLFQKIEDGFEFDLIVCNPPYISEVDFEELDEEVKFYDPKLALVAGHNGYMIYEKIIKKAKQFLAAKGTILFEVGIRQSGLVSKYLQDKGFEVSVVQDYNKIDRIVIGRL